MVEVGLIIGGAGGHCLGGDPLGCPFGPATGGDLLIEVGDLQPQIAVLLDKIPGQQDEALVVERRLPEQIAAGNDVLQSPGGEKMPQVSGMIGRSVGGDISHR